MKKIYMYHLALLCFLAPAFTAFAQDAPVKLTASYERLNEKEVLLTVKAAVQDNAKLYSAIKLPNDAPSSELSFDSASAVRLTGELTESGTVIKEKEPLLDNLEIAYIKDSVTWQQKMELDASDSAVVEGKANLFLKEGDTFNAVEEDFTIVVASGMEAGTAAQDDTQEGEKSLWLIFVTGLLAGFGAFIMPCIYAMVPVTVSFFTKRSVNRKAGIRNAIYYSLSIIGIFTLLGFLITLIFGQGALNNMASSAVFNIFVFLMFVVFGISFLGAFEITLPASWTNKIDSKAGMSSFSGIFFMALTLVIVSFSCTVPFVGGLAVLTTQGGKLAPIVGFFGFSLALALPFAIFAFFPALLNQMGKSGGWLNSIKVSLGFVELALALKFLSSADLAYHWRLLDREVYLSLWIVIFGLLGLYLLGKLKFKHDDSLPQNDYGLPYLTVTRLFFAIASFSFTVYMIPGLWGAPLNGISAWLPETKTQDFNLNKSMHFSGSPAASAFSEELKPVKYTDILESEVPGVEAFFDFDEALAAARALNKPIMVDFTGHSCANCRKMEREVLNDPEVMKRLQNDFVVVSLYVDDRYKLPPGEWYVSENDGRKVKTLGDKNLDFEVTIANNSAQPLYVFVDKDGKLIKNAGGYNPNIPRFVNILDEVKQGFHSAEAK